MSDTDIVLLDDSRISRLESAIEEMNGKLPPLKEFILPGGDEFCVRLHVTRTVCRRSERSCVTLMNSGVDVKSWLQYLNRLSDYLFVLVRYANQKNDDSEALWDREK